MAGRPTTHARSGAWSALAATLAVAVSGATFLLSELVIVALVATLGPASAFGVLTLVCGAISTLIAFAFDAGEGKRGLPALFARARAWIDRNLDVAEKRARRLANLSEVLAFALLSLTAGPFLTTLAVKLRGASPQAGYLLGVASSALFSAVWVVVYAGGIAAVGMVFGL